MKKFAAFLLVLFAFAPLQAKIHFTDLPDTSMSIPIINKLFLRNIEPEIEAVITDE